MMRVERHPRVDADVDEVLAYTFREFGPAQVPLYEDLKPPPPQGGGFVRVRRFRDIAGS
jgi:hypothetical protein